MMPDDPSPEAQWREIAAHLREMAERAERGEYHWLYVAARPMDADDQVDDDLYVCSSAVPEFRACLLDAIEGVDVALDEAASKG
jgi:hypothetical protein